MHTLRRHGSIAVDELASAVRDYVVIDIRDHDDWVRGHVAGAIHLPVEQLAGDWPDPDPRFPVAVFSDDGSAADAAAEVLRARGRDAITVAGGAAAWRAAGLAFVTNRV